MSNLSSIDKFRAGLREHRPPEGALFRAIATEPKALDSSTRSVRFCFSDGSVDRMGDTISADGWDLHNFNKNPVALFAHDSNAPPIGRASNLLIEDKRLMGDIEFMPAETYAFADTIYRMVLGGYLRSVSVGFLPLEYKWADDEEGRPWGIDFQRQELLEISLVPLPANPNALVEARAKGIDTRPWMEWAEKTLERGDKILVPRAEMTRLLKAAKERPMTRTRSKPRWRSDDGMDEEDESAGGAAVGNCGRPIGEECGMKDVAECSIHGMGEIGMGDEENSGEAKRINALVRRAVADALKSAQKPRRKADDDVAADGTSEGDSDRPDVNADHEKAVRMCSMHLKAMGDCLDVANEHHEKAMSCIQEALDNLDAAPPKDDGEGPGSDPEAEKAARAKAALAAIKKRLALT